MGKEKKEIGMEKLIELLNEYRRIDFVPERQEGILMVAEEKVISKKFGFIKWLVENDKIDILQLDNRIALSEFNKVERVLMALSISDTPIEDLILYLK